MNENISFRDPGEPPVIDWIDKGQIDIDPAYQRRLDENRVLRIVEGFAWDSFGAVVVAPGEGGRFHCIDGQHRLAAAQRHPKVTVVPAVVIAGKGAQIEADTFVTVNRDRKNISALDLFWAQMAAGDDDARTVAQVCERAGVTIARYPTVDYPAGHTIAISAIKALVDKRGAMRAREVLEVLVKAGLAPIKGEWVRAAELLRFDDEFRDQVDADGMSASLEGHDEEIATEAKAFAKTHRMAVAKAFASVWFRRTRKRRMAA